MDVLIGEGITSEGAVQVLLEEIKKISPFITLGVWKHDEG